MEQVLGGAHAHWETPKIVTTDQNMLLVVQKEEGEEEEEEEEEEEQQQEGEGEGEEKAAKKAKKVRVHCGTSLLLSAIWQGACYCLLGCHLNSATLDETILLAWFAISALGSAKHGARC